MSLSDQIKAINLANISQQAGVELRRHGNKLVGLCPLHSEKTGSFTVFQDNHFKCFGCGAHGDTVDFVQRLHGIDFQAALRFLGIEKGTLSVEACQAIKERKQQRAKMRVNKKHERETAYTIALKIRSAYEVMPGITPENLDDFAEPLGFLAQWEHSHDILCFGSDMDKQQLCDDLKNMPTVYRNSLFRPDFNMGELEY